MFNSFVRSKKSFIYVKICHYFRCCATNERRVSLATTETNTQREKKERRIIIIRKTSLINYNDLLMFVYLVNYVQILIHLWIKFPLFKNLPVSWNHFAKFKRRWKCFGPPLAHRWTLHFIEMRFNMWQHFQNMRIFSFFSLFFFTCLNNISSFRKHLTCALISFLINAIIFLI